jgi:hypothetical protein
MSRAAARVVLLQAYIRYPQQKKHHQFEKKPNPYGEARRHRTPRAGADRKNGATGPPTTPIDGRGEEIAVPDEKQPGVGVMSTWS